MLQAIRMTSNATRPTFAWRLHLAVVGQGQPAKNNKLLHCSGAMVALLKPLSDLQIKDGMFLQSICNVWNIVLRYLLVNF